MEKGTIIYMGGFELPDKNAAAHRVIANAKIMRNLGYKIIFVGMNKDRNASDGLLRYEKDFFGFESWSIPYPVTFRNWLKYILGLKEILKFIKNAWFDGSVSVICYNYPAIAQLRINLLCRKLKIKQFADVTEWYDASGGVLLYRLVKWIDTSLRMYFVNGYSDGILTTSKYITSFYAKRNKLTLELPTLYDVDNFDIPKVIENSEIKKFIYVGIPFEAARVNNKRTNLKERLDLNVLVFHRLFEEGEKFEFSVYGLAEEDYLQVFPEHKKLLVDMSGCVHFYGRKPNSVVLKSISQSDFSIFFRDETRVTLAGFPSKLAESISCGTPVISNKMLSIEDYESIEGLFLAEKGEEYSLIKKLMALSALEVNSLKESSFLSKAFDYRCFQLRFEMFLNKVGM